MVHWQFWRKKKAPKKGREKKRRLQQATYSQHIRSDSQQVGNTSVDVYRKLNDLFILLSKHDIFLREDHHKRGLVSLSKFISENFYRLSLPQQQKVQRNLEFIETDKHILTALADSRRLRVVEILTVLRKQNIKNRQYVSERTNRLVEAGILERIRVGKKVYYSKVNVRTNADDMSGDR